MGFLDNMDDPKNQMLLALGLGLLQGSGRTNKNFGADLGAAGTQGLLAYNGARQQQAKLGEEAQQKEMRTMQMEQMRQATAAQKAEFERKQGLLSLQGQFYNPGTPAVPLDPRQQEGGQQEIPGKPPGFNTRAFIPEALKRGYMTPMEADAMMKAERVTVAPGATVGRYEGDRFVPDYAAPDKPPTGMIRGPDGKDVPNPAYVAMQERIRAAGRPQITVDNHQENEFNKKMGTQFAENYNGILQSGASAENKLRDIQRFQNITGKIPTGKLEPFKAEVGRLASGLGVQVDMDKLGYQEGLEALSNQFALTLRNPSGGAGMPGALSDKDREFLVSMVPGLAKTPAGNAVIIEAFKRTAQREKDVAKLAREYKKKTGKFDEGFYEVLAQNFGGKDLLGDLYAQAASMGAQGSSSDWHSFQVVK